MAELFGEIMGEAAAIKGIAMPALPPALMSDDMQGECFSYPVFLPACYPVSPVPIRLAFLHRCGWRPFYTESPGEGLH